MDFMVNMHVAMNLIIKNNYGQEITQIQPFISLLWL